MKIIHTADWHLGNSIHSVDRTIEQRSFLNWLTQVIKDQDIDALVVAGDIFDTYSPSIAAQRMYYSFLASLVGTNCRNVIIVGGNHDSGKLLEAPQELLSAVNVHVVGRIENKNIEDMIFTLKGNDAGDDVICAAVPFINDLELRRFSDGADIESLGEGKFSDTVYSKIYNAFLEKAIEACNGKDTTIIATGHLYAAGLEGRYEGAEKEEKADDGVAVLDVVGNLGKVHIDSFPEGFDYVALGHIHYKTKVAKSNRVMYSGSPFVMGYDDSNIKHYIIRLDTNDGDDKHKVVATPIEVPEWIRFKRIEGSRDEIVNKVNTLIASEEENELPIYLELYYSPEDGSYLQEKMDGIAFPDHIRIVSWKIRKKEGVSAPSFGDYDIHSIQNIEPEDVVKQLVLSKCSLSEEQKAEMSDEEISKYEEETVNKYLPYFMKAFDLVSKEENDEDN